MQAWFEEASIPPRLSILVFDPGWLIEVNAMQLPRRLPACAFSVLVAVLSVAAITGCGSNPITPVQEAIAASSVRGTTITYIMRGSTQAAQQERVAQVLTLVDVVNQSIKADGAVIAGYDQVTMLANSYVDNTDRIKAMDKPWAKAIIYEVVSTAKALTDPEIANIGAERARLVLALTAEVERTAMLFAVKPASQ